MIGIAVLYTVPFPFCFSVSLFPFPPFSALSFCLSSRVFSWTLHFPGQCWARILEGILVVFLRLQPERISGRIVEQIVGCSISRRIEHFYRNLKPVSPCLPHSRSVRLYFAQVHSCSYSLNLQIHIQSTLCSMMKIGLAQSFPHCALEFSGFPGFPGFRGSCGVRG